MSLRLASAGVDGAHDLLFPLAPLFPDDCGSVESSIKRPLPCQPHDVGYRLLAPANASLSIQLRQVGQRNDGSDRLAGTLDDQSLPGSGLVYQLTEVLPYVECGDRSHSAIIAL